MYAYILPISLFVLHSLYIYVYAYTPFKFICIALPVYLFIGISSSYKIQYPNTQATASNASPLKITVLSSSLISLTKANCIVWLEQRKFIALHKL